MSSNYNFAHLDLIFVFCTVWCSKISIFLCKPRFYFTLFPTLLFINTSRYIHPSTYTSKCSSIQLLFLFPVSVYFLFFHFFNSHLSTNTINLRAIFFNSLPFLTNDTTSSHCTRHWWLYVNSIPLLLIILSLTFLQHYLKQYHRP